MTQRAGYHYDSKPKQSSEHIVEVKRDDGTLPTLLYDLLRLATPHGMEDHIINLLPCRKLGTRDVKGNFIVKVGENPKTLFSAHMDTVHDVDKSIINDKTKVAVLNIVKIHNDAPADMDKFKDYIWGAIKKPDGKFGATQLGADDKVGCWILCEMIDHEIPGLYIFHVGEECGGIGSRHIANETPELLKGIQRAIAFDRMHTTDVIGWQRGGQCASFQFTKALADELNKLIDLPTNKFQPQVHGMFTDTANYTKLIPECTNLSVGYYEQHTGNEHLDVLWLRKFFLPAVLEMKWDELPVGKSVEREPVYSRSGSVWGPDTIWDPELSRYIPKDEFKKKWLSEGENYVPFKNITEKTPTTLLPPWKPEDYLPDDITSEGLKALIKHWEFKTSREEVCAVIARFMLEANNNELLYAIAQAKLDKLTAALGDEKTDELLGKKKIENKSSAQIIDITPKKPAQLALPKPTALFDEQGFPTNKEEMLTRTRKKMAIIATYITHRGALRLARENFGKFDLVIGKFNKMSKSLNKESARGVPKGLYRNINSLLFNSTALVLDVKGVTHPEVVVRAVTEAVSYMKDNAHEPGFPEKA